MTDDRGTLPVTVLLPPSLLEAAPDAAPEQIERALSELMEDLGVAGRPVARLAVAQPTPNAPLVRVQVAGQACPIPRATVHEALAYVNGTPLVATDTDAGSVLQRLEGPGGAGPEGLGELLALVCRSAVSARPGVLLPDSPFRAALDLGMSIAGQDPWPEPSVLGDGPRERLLDEAAAATADVHIDPAYLRALVTADEQRATELFPFLREGLFLELGLHLPPMHLRQDPSLRPAGYAFRFHGVRTLPRIGLSPGTILVNDTAGRLRLMDVEAQPTRNPATGSPGAVTAAEHQEALEASGLTTWDPFGYLILTFAAALRQHAHVFMTAKVADRMGQDLSAAFPALLSNSHVTPEALAPVLRDLLWDEVSVRNLRRIVELFLRYETMPESEDKGDLVIFIRAGLADAIATKAARNTTTVVVYLLDPVIEEAFARQDQGMPPDQSGDALAERLCAALQAELSGLPPTAQTPALLTRDELRRPLRTAVRSEHPLITVLGYGDLPPHYNVQPVDRISWS